MSMSPIYNSRLLKLYVAYIADRYPQVNLDGLFRKTRISKRQVEDPGHWFSQEQVDLFHQTAAELTGNPNISREVGRYGAFNNATGAIKQHVLGLLNIASTYLLLAKIYPMFSRGANIKARKMGATKIEIIAEPVSGVQEKAYQCDNRLGLFESMSALFTAKYASVTHDRCLHRGDAHCRYEVTWEGPRHLIWARCFRVCFIALMPMLLIGPWVFPWPWWSLVGPGAAIGLIALGLYASRLEKQELKSTIQKQGNVAEEHIKEVDFRYRGALLIQNIGQATSQIRDLTQLAQVVVGNIEKFLDFDRGVLMLAGENRTRLIYAAGFGFDESKTELLQKTKFRLDNDDARGIFIQAFREQRPILVDDVDALKGTLSSRSQLFARQIGSKSLICLPLVYENQSLGILAVDNIKRQRPLTQSDVNLLMGVAYQIAVSIFSTLAYKNLQASEERYRSLYESAPTPYFSISADRATIVNCNMAATRLLGCPRSQLIGSPWFNYFSDELGQQTRSQWIRSVLEQGRSILHEEVKLIRPDGQAIWADLSMEPHRDAQGNVLEGRCVLIDMTERKRLEEKLRHAQKMEVMGTLSGGVAHDLSNILAAIVSYPDLLLMDIDADHAMYEPLNKIRAAGMRAAAIVRDLLTLARLGVQLTEVIDCNGLIREFMKSPEFENLQAYFPKVRVHVEMDEGLPAVKGSSVHLVKTLFNIVNNSAEAMPNGGDIHIVTRCRRLEDDPLKNRHAGQYVMIAIQDDGEGIAEEDVDRIFEPFFTRKIMGRSGTGLGMAIAWATVQDHQGFIDIQSELGTGTTVFIYLPATHEVHAPPLAVPRIEEMMGRGERIVVIDDEVEHLAITAKLMTRLGYRVVTMDNAPAALAYLETHPADLVLLDMILGNSEMDGLALYQQILSLYPCQKAVITSGYAETYRVKQALELGAGAFVKKPFAIRQIAAVVRNELDRKGCDGRQVADQRGRMLKVV
jgi:PAS domain S-box-containing protein